MAGKTKPMSIVKQILLQLHHGQSKKSIVREMGVSKNTVRRYIQLAQGCGYPIQELIKMDDPILESLLNRQVTVSRDHVEELEELFPWMRDELKRTGVNRFVLWGEYRKRYPEGYSYSQFCFYYQLWLKAQNVSMVMPHEPGDKIYIDFAGKKLMYTDLKTGANVEVEFFVGIMGYSQLSFAYAVESQSSADFLFGCSRMMAYIGGSTKVIVCDNLKSGVIKANRYEPEINQIFNDFCTHYNMAVLPARPAKPKDKSLVESMVRILYSRIYAPLRNRTFYSINEINTAIAELLEAHNNTPFERQPESRRQLFESQERHLLQELPESIFELKCYRKATVQKNSHILLGEDRHYYSVPMRYMGRQVSVIYTASDVNIFCGQERVAYHKRDRRAGKYTTVDDHVPSSHKYILGLNPEEFIKWGTGICSEAGQYIEKLIASKKVPEQAYKSCQGLQSLTRKLGKEKFIEACRMGLDLKVYNYMFIKNVMENKENKVVPKIPVLPFHENIRGAQSYQ